MTLFMESPIEVARVVPVGNLLVGILYGAGTGDGKRAAARSGRRANSPIRVVAVAEKPERKGPYRVTGEA